MVNREDCVIFKQEYGNELLVNQAHVGIRTLHALEISTATLREFLQSLKNLNIPLFQ